MSCPSSQDYCHHFCNCSVDTRTKTGLKNKAAPCCCCSESIRCLKALPSPGAWCEPKLQLPVANTSLAEIWAGSAGRLDFCRRTRKMRLFSCISWVRAPCRLGAVRLQHTFGACAPSVLQPYVCGTGSLERQQGLSCWQISQDLNWHWFRKFYNRWLFLFWKLGGISPPEETSLV